MLLAAVLITGQRSRRFTRWRPIGLCTAPRALQESKAQKLSPAAPPKQIIVADFEIRRKLIAMGGNSSRVSSSQVDVHPRLREVVARHRLRCFRRPVPEHTQLAFEKVAEVVRGGHRPVVMDAGCGTGTSTLSLARQHPEHWVVGVDRSAHRLARSGCRDFMRRDNAMLVRADVQDFWRLALDAGWRCAGQYFLYPNPWPKPGHLMRRWHAHPVFPAIVGLGGILEMRTNWSVYALEFVRTLRLYGFRPSHEQFQPDDFLSPFERKYNLSGHALYRVRCDLEEGGDD